MKVQGENKATTAEVAAVTEGRRRRRLAPPVLLAQYGYPQLLPGWREVVEQNGQTYFYNDVTGQSQWEAPLVQQGQYGSTQQGQGGYTPVNLPPGWRQLFDENGQFYFYNDNTG